MTRFNLRFVLLTGDVMTRSSEFWREVDRADVILATPEKNGFIVETSFLKWVLWVFRIYFCRFDR